jgi:hypothetical protein
MKGLSKMMAKPKTEQWRHQTKGGFLCSIPGQITPDL